jgi:hypothetical protein
VTTFEIYCDILQTEQNGGRPTPFFFKSDTWITPPHPTTWTATKLPAVFLSLTSSFLVPTTPLILPDEVTLKQAFYSLIGLLESDFVG